jgi:iron complex transport system substrate-binding protein
MKEQFTVIEFLTKNNIACCVIDNHNVVSILKSFTLLGNTFDRKREADSLVRQITTELADTTTSDHGKPRILLCIDRENKGSGTISKMYAAGGRTFYTELIAAAGGVNALSDTSIIYPQLSIEGAVRLQPDIVIDFSYPSQTLSCERLISDWNSLTMLAAVRNKMVFCRAADYLTIPGPRLHFIVKDLKEIVATYKKTHKN